MDTLKPVSVSFGLSLGTRLGLAHSFIQRLDAADVTVIIIFGIGISVVSYPLYTKPHT